MSDHSTPGFREFSFQNRGVTVSGRTIGNGGPVFVFLHGFPDFWESFIPLAEKLNPAGTNIFLDLRGYNFAGKPTEPASYAILNIVSDIAVTAAMMRGRDMVFVGHSWGGAAAWWLWMANLPGFRAYVSIGAPHPAAFFAAMEDEQQWAMSAYARDLAHPGASLRLDMKKLAEWSDDPAHRERLIAALERSSAFGITSYYSQSYPLDRRALGTLPPGPKPFLLVYGKSDPYIAKNTYESSALQTENRVEIAAVDGGHFIHFDRPDAVSETIANWLGHV